MSPSVDESLARTPSPGSPLGKIVGIALLAWVGMMALSGAGAQLVLGQSELGQSELDQPELDQSGRTQTVLAPSGATVDKPESEVPHEGEDESAAAAVPNLEGPFAPLGGGTPFGLHRGSSLQDVESLVGLLSPVSEQDYMAIQVPGSPPLLETLTLTVTPEDGLCRLRASTALIQDPGDGSVVLDAFERLRAPLEQAFGEQHTTLDTLLPDSPYAAADQWLAGLRHRHRALLMLWNRESGSVLPDPVEHVSLSARGYSDREGFLVLEYTFTNWSACEARRVADQAIE